MRGPKQVVKTGKTPVLTAAEARGLLDSIETATLIGLRDRALLGLMVYGFARISAALAMRVADYYTQGKRSYFRLHEKGRQVSGYSRASYGAGLDGCIYRAGGAGDRPERPVVSVGRPPAGERPPHQAGDGPDRCVEDD